MRCVNVFGMLVFLKMYYSLLPCPGALAGEHLIPNKDVDFVILNWWRRYC